MDHRAGGKSGYPCIGVRDRKKPAGIRPEVAKISVLPEWFYPGL
jgi:hypothetical protein